ncbi:hypothetical protein L208DRAFT_1253655, partial [Tricholoma matsutake]
ILGIGKGVLRVFSSDFPLLGAPPIPVICSIILTSDFPLLEAEVALIVMRCVPGCAMFDIQCSLFVEHCPLSFLCWCCINMVPVPHEAGVVGYLSPCHPSFVWSIDVLHHYCCQPLSKAVVAVVGAMWHQWAVGESVMLSVPCHLVATY